MKRSIVVTVYHVQTVKLSGGSHFDCLQTKFLGSSGENKNHYCFWEFEGMLKEKEGCILS